MSMIKKLCCLMLLLQCYLVYGFVIQSPVKPCGGSNGYDDPCLMATCPAYPNAVCRANGCKAVFLQSFIGGIYKEVDCGDYCTVPATVKNKLNLNDDIFRSGSVLTITCVDNFIADKTKVECIGAEWSAPFPDCVLDVKPTPCPICLFNNCQFASCPSYPHAKCRTKHCSCDPEFYSGKEVYSMQKCHEPIACPMCIGNDCEDRECPKYPKAVCQEKYCSCKTHFVDGDNFYSHEECFEDPPVACPICFIDPCYFASCSSYPHAKCQTKHCTCAPEFVIDDKVIPVFQCNGPPTPPPTACPKCEGNICQGKICERFPKARCEYEPCSCNIRFIYEDMVISNDQCKVPKACPRCKESPCKANTCPSVPNANCENPKCTCDAIFKDPATGKVLSDYECAKNLGYCRVFCPADKRCPPGDCPGFPGSKCIVATCQNCEVIFFDKGGNSISSETCLVDPNPPKSCPICIENKCKNKECQKHPKAVCKEKFCSCETHFVDGDKSYSHEECFEESCPWNARKVKCTNPCQGATCKGHKNAVCRPNYCGRCEAEWFVNGKQVRCAKTLKKTKPGNCPLILPQLHLMTPCVVLCRNDYECYGRQKCCSSGCSNQCTLPV